MITRAKPYYREEWTEELSDYIANYDYSDDRLVVYELENMIKELFNRKYAVAVNSASNAIFMSLYVWSKKYPERHQVVIPNWGYPAAARACKVLGLEVVPVDINKRTLGMSKVDMNHRTLAVIHIENNGVVGDVKALKWVTPNSVLFIEDSAPSMTQKTAGIYGDVSIFSFSPTKPLMSGEGAVMLMDDEELWNDLKSLRYNPDYSDIGLSLNFMLSPFLAAYLIPQLDSLTEIQFMRERLHDQYKNYIDIFEEESNSHGSIMYLSKKAQKIHEKLNIFGIEHRYKYYPLYEYNPKKFPVSCDVFHELIDLPLHHELTVDQIKSICLVVKRTEDE